MHFLTFPKTRSMVLRTCMATRIPFGTTVLLGQTEVDELAFLTRLQTWPEGSSPGSARFPCPLPP